MATYCIGDVHGCYNEFMALLEEIKFDEAKDELLLTGDLIGRGPFPVETMKAVMSMKNHGFRARQSRFEFFSSSRRYSYSASERQPAGHFRLSSLCRYREILY